MAFILLDAGIQHARVILLVHNCDIFL